MSSVSRFAPALALVALVLAGCDTNSSNSALQDVDGSYEFTELVFDPQPEILDPVNVVTALNTSATRFEIFGEDGQVLFRSRLADATASRRTDLTATATRGRVAFTAVSVDDEVELADILLPRAFSLTYNVEQPGDLTGDLPLTNVDLAAFDSRYNGLDPVDGTLRVRLTRDLGD